MLNGHMDSVNQITKINEEMLASASNDATIKVWRFRTAELVTTLIGHTDKVRTLAVDVIKQLNAIKDNKESKENINAMFLENVFEANLLASGSDDKCIKIWNIDQRADQESLYECINTINGHTQPITCLLFAADNVLISGSEDTSIKVWNYKTENGLCLATLSGHKFWINALIKVNEDLIASASNDTLIKIWNYRNFQCVLTLAGHVQAVKILFKTPTNDYTIVSSSDDKTVKVWDITTGKCLDTISNMSPCVNCLVKLNKIE